MNTRNSTIWDGTERRKPNSCRRNADRRSFQERRSDRRDRSQRHRRSFLGWIRALTKARLGVDRRKNIDQRITPNRRSLVPRSMLTKDEIADLLR